MKLINDLVEDLTSSSTSIESCLLKAKVLAHQIGDEDFKKWVNDEINGYSQESKVPPYRIVKLTILGTVSNGYYRYSDRPLPTLHIEESIRNNLTTQSIRNGISNISNLIDTEEKYAVHIAPEFYGIFNKNFSEGYEVEYAKGVHSVGAMQGIITQIKSRLLDFLLGISDRIPKETAPSNLKQIAKDIGVNEMFKNSVFGNNTTIVIGGGSINSVSNTIIHNDIESLVSFLRKNNVTEKDIDELKVAIASDSTEINPTEKMPGRRVSDWTKDMLAKAGTASWQVTIEAAGNLLATALGAYYGIK